MTEFCRFLLIVSFELGGKQARLKKTKGDGLPVVYIFMYKSMRHGFEFLNRIIKSHMAAFTTFEII